MKRYHLIKGVLGGSDVYDENGRQVGYSLPSILGDGEDFYDMEGNAVGMSFDDEYGGAFVGVGNDSYGCGQEDPGADGCAARGGEKYPAEFPGPAGGGNGRGQPDPDHRDGWLSQKTGVSAEP